MGPVPRQGAAAPEPSRGRYFKCVSNHCTIRVKAFDPVLTLKKTMPLLRVDVKFDGSACGFSES